MKLRWQSSLQHVLALALTLLVALTALTLPACSIQSESAERNDEIKSKLHAHVAYWNDVVDVHNRLGKDWNRASAKADRVKTGLTGPADYPEELMEAVEAYTGKRPTSSQWNQFSSAVVDYINIAIRATVFYKLAAQGYERASHRMSSTVTPPERLADAHRALARAEAKTGRVLKRSAKQIDRAMRMDDADSTSIFFGEGRRLFRKAMAAAEAAVKLEIKAWKKWKRAMKAEEKRLRSEAS